MTRVAGADRTIEVSAMAFVVREIEEGVGRARVGAGPFGPNEATATVQVAKPAFACRAAQVAFALAVCWIADLGHAHWVDAVELPGAHYVGARIAAGGSDARGRPSGCRS